MVLYCRGCGSEIKKSVKAGSFGESKIPKTLSAMGLKYLFMAGVMVCGKSSRNISVIICVRDFSTEPPSKRN